MTADPFAHHPELRGEITPAAESFFRDMSLAKLEAILTEKGLPTGWWRSDAEREANRIQTLADRRDDDLWVFAYGSLMWDPGVHFSEVRRAHVPDYARRYILKDIYGGRGTREAPGAMAALDRGPGCEGLIFRIPRVLLEEETRILWHREYVAPAYVPQFVAARYDGGAVAALTFVADHAAELIDASMTHAEQVTCFVNGAGFLGTSADYLRNVALHFDRLGIEDAETQALLRDVEARLAASG